MFNLKKQTKTAQMPYEKYNRENPLGPKVEGNASIGEKKLPHREGYEDSIAEDQMPKREWEDNKKQTQVTEKMLESAKSSYVTHRSDAANLDMPPISALVEKIRQKRLADDYTVKKTPHWSQTFNEKKQQGALPEWKGNAPQHDKPLLPNDYERFTGTDTNPTTFHKDTIKPLVGNITTADIDRVVHGIKIGQAAEYDAAILAILRLAHDEHRELGKIEQKTVANLKIARTKNILQKC